MREFNVYILASLSRVLYIGVSNDLRRRMYEHQHGLVPGFTSEYRVTRLVYFEQTRDASAATSREKQLKRWPRARKLRLIEQHNASWDDLSATWFLDERR